MTPSPVAIVARLRTDQAIAWRIAEQVAEAFDPADTACALIEAADGWLLELYLAGTVDQKSVRDIVAGAAGSAAARALAFETVAKQDWIATSLAGLAPVEAGRFVVHGRHDRARIAANRIGIEIDASLAFGTGHHGTTRGCLLALDTIIKRARGRRPRILDVGTGSGVLAIAAAKALRSPVLASDNDRRATLTARTNARLNR